eukprot:TRINITY_DN49602_c0_g1_i1.p1 TRINITY_DN49602_c0_g1~~TRINITY_DN49602_c0_g1_i1.p1  ORF type:complete len:657 (-),score=113.65 TRINITY_DN49602_c0_g1_i1:219-2012(-)
MTIYYDPGDSITRSALAVNTWKHTAFKAVLASCEFYLYCIFHAGIVVLMIAVDYVGREIPWEAVGALQFLLTFLLIFFNEHCYQRYLRYYSSCMAAVHGGILFVQELVVCMPPHTCGEVEKHRRTSVRYMLAAIFLFHMSLTGGMAPGSEFREVLKKGLLTETETYMLQQYPGGRITIILLSWSLQIVKHALTQPCFWRPQSMHAAHYHNRMNVHVCSVIKASHEVTYLMAQPIPFPYFHIMNFIMAMNFVVLALAFATYKTFVSVILYAFALMIYMGLREVSVALADPFGQDHVDFPLDSFMEYAFNHSVSLLDGFSHPSVYERVLTQLDFTRPFDDKEMLQPCVGASARMNKSRLGIANTYAWDAPHPLTLLQEGVETRSFLTEVLAGPGGTGASAEPSGADALGPSDDVFDLDAEASRVARAEARRNALDAEKRAVRRFRFELARVEARISELLAARPTNTLPAALRLPLPALPPDEDGPDAEAAPAPPAAAAEVVLSVAPADDGHEAARDAQAELPARDSAPTARGRAGPTARSQRLREDFESFDDASLRIRKMLADVDEGLRPRLRQHAATEAAEAAAALAPPARARRRSEK